MIDVEVAVETEGHLMKPSIRLLALLAFVAAAAGAFLWSGAYNIAADDPHWRLTKQVLETVRERSIETRAVDAVAVDLADESLIRAGAGNYDAMCAVCHLEPGADGTELSIGLNPPPPDLTRHDSEDPAATFWIIKHGIKMTAMPAWGKSMDDESIWGMVAFLRRLPGMSHGDYHELVEASGGHSHGHGESDADHDHEVGDEHSDAAQVDVSDQAQAAAATADRFFAALSAGDLEAVAAELDPQVVILESGGGEHSAAEYLGHHAREDAEFLKTAKQRLLRRSARVSGELAWVASESELEARHDGKPIRLLGTETMVLRASKAGWKIVHIHWSSRAIKAAPSG